ncbi:MAG: hypothetical protein AAF558_14340, partial [Verrucomicrobiota bacterium]
APYLCCWPFAGQFARMSTLVVASLVIPAATQGIWHTLLGWVALLGTFALGIHLFEKLYPNQT